jgi:hypothetical protein
MNGSRRSLKLNQDVLLIAVSNGVLMLEKEQYVVNHAGETHEYDAKRRMKAMACQCAPGLMALKSYADVKIGRDQFKGCVGDSNHTYGYHLCYPSADDYSLKEPRDKGHAGYACAYDLGMGWKDSRKWFAWFVQQIKAGRYPDICELIGSYDGQRVLYFRGPHFKTENYTGSGHDTWCHISVWRDSARRDHSYILRDWFKENDRKGKQIMFLLQKKGQEELYVSNGIERRYIKDWNKGARPLIEVMKHNGLDTTIVQVANDDELDDVGGKLAP